MFGTKSAINVTIFGSTRHALIEREDQPKARITGVLETDDVSASNEDVGSA